ncbi:hypothetical protein [Hymenobacter convexus]|uniref:hypothetical protein n=1 Tax=Hymenobacter sp. CA1UV-4 TaxID=3063782 RepID=UPI002713443C|nr:hypothetical protein [Hymenobacter sp. CA1UV-4]MDO7851578.1 hypothetical protein [Hymenobacter sp. CA1UV-4]
MLELTSAGRPVVLTPGTSAQLEYNSPLFDEDTIRGTFSYSFNVPAPPNGPLYGYPERPDAAAEPGGLLPAELAESGVPLLSGSQRVRSASAKQYSVAVGGGLSGAGLSERPLSSFAYGGLREVERLVPIDPGSPLLMPGLVRHANEVVANPAAYDYVFAPLRNEYRTEAEKTASVTPDPLPFPPRTVNVWAVYGAQLLGMPAGGSFSYNIDLALPGAAQFQQFEMLPAYCPYPKLRYVLRAALQECGLAIDADGFLPGELGDLVLAGNARLVDRGDVATLRFSLADVLPELTFGELLAALRQDLGIVLYQDRLSGLVRTAYLFEQVAADAAYLDLSHLLAGAAEVSVGDAAGLTLTYLMDSSDELTKDWLTKQPAATLTLAAVATVADLPATARLADNPQNGQARLVEALDTYYSCTLSARSATEVNLTWAPLVLRLPNVPVNGGGDEQAQRISYTAVLPTWVSGQTDADPVPAISQPVYRADAADVARSSALHLLFYNGLQPTADGLGHYPQLSPDSASGTLSVRLSGPAGTYAQLLAGWLAVKLRAAAYQLPLRLSAADLARLDLVTPVQLAGVRYLVRKLSATAPLRKPATVELVRL